MSTNEITLAGVRSRGRGVQSVFTVLEKAFLTPHYIRVKFSMTDEQLELFSHVQIGGHNKLLLPGDVRRTYTTRHIDFIEKELWIDFVAHGDNGPASAWASSANPGDQLSIAMKEGRRSLFPEADCYLFIGDSTALPVIGAMLEQLPSGAQARVIMEVPSKADELKLYSEANLAVRWVHNSKPEEGSSLAAIVRETQIPGEHGFVFVAAEYDTVKALKHFFRDELGWKTERYNAVSYWKRGESEDQSSAKRREERQLAV